MDMKSIVSGIIKNAESANPINQGDYVGDDGFYYCGKCHTPKQAKYDFFFGERVVPIPCECEKQRRREEEEERERTAKAHRIEILRRAAFPDADMRHWTFENDDGKNERVTNAMKKYVDNFSEFYEKGKGLLLYGNCGTGKTYAACEVANALIDKEYPAFATNFSRILNELQETFEKQEYIDSLNRYRLLVIDDLGIERDTPFAKEQVYNVVDGRYRSCKPMIITTNMSIEEIKNPKDIGNARIYERVLERCFPIEMNGASRRKKTIIKEYDSMKNMLGL